MTSTHTFISLTLTFVIISTLASFAFAHGSGVSYEEQKDGYLVDIGYSIEFPKALEQVRFDLTIIPDDIESLDDELFTDVWIRIAQERELFFSGGINKPDFGLTGFTYVFPKEGVYEITARFQNAGENVVEVTFPLEILPPEEGRSNINPFIAIGVGFLLGAAIMFFIPRRS